MTPIKRIPLEKEIQKQILDYLRLRGIFCWTCKTVGTYDPRRRVYRANTTFKGVADILGILPAPTSPGHTWEALGRHKGQFLAVEVKRVGGKVSDDQKAFLERINKEGGLAFVARSLNDVINTLDNKREIVIS